jgi:hypothetical protein
MARSLTVSTEETPSTNWLLTGFILVVVAFLMIGGVASVLLFDDADAAAMNVELEASAQQ